MKRWMISLLLVSFSTHAQLQHCKPGPYKIGFRSVIRFDNSRTAVKEQAQQNLGRIIQINLWYPTATEGKKMCFTDYVSLAGSELDSTPTSSTRMKGIARYFSWPAFMKADNASYAVYLEKCPPMQAVNDAAEQKGEFPLILLIHGFAADHAYLAEYLAGNGFVVLQVPVKGSTTYELDYAGMGLENQVLDYEFAIKIIADEFGANVNQVGAAGFSFGAQSAVALALRNNAIKSVVSLDGGIGSTFGVELLKSQSYYKEASLQAAILHLYNPRDEHTNLSWLNSLKKTHLLSMKNMEHGFFTSFGLLRKSLPDIMGAQAPDPGDGYEALMYLTNEFFHVSLKSHKMPGNSFLSEQMMRHKWIKECTTS